MKWQIKFLQNAIFGTFSLSNQGKIRHIKRNFRPLDVQIDLWTLEQGLQQVEMLRMAGCELSGKDYLELGTGWSPVIPLIFSLAGCKSLTLVDSQRLMDRHSFRETCQKLLIHKDKISQKLQVASIDIEK